MLGVVAFLEFCGAHTRFPRAEDDDSEDHGEGKRLATLVVLLKSQNFLLQ